MENINRRRKLKSCFWTVKIIDSSISPSFINPAVKKFYWRATTERKTGIIELVQKGFSETKHKSETEWKIFAKINDIPRFRISEKQNYVIKQTPPQFIIKGQGFTGDERVFQNIPSINTKPLALLYDQKHKTISVKKIKKDPLQIARAVIHINAATIEKYIPLKADDQLTGNPLIDQDAGGQVIHYLLENICDELNAINHPMDSKLFPIIKMLAGNKIKSFGFGIFGNKIIIKLK